MTNSGDQVKGDEEIIRRRLAFLAMTDAEKMKHCVFCGEEFGPNVCGHINCGGRLLDVKIPEHSAVQGEPQPIYLSGPEKLRMALDSCKHWQHLYIYAKAELEELRASLKPEAPQHGHSEWVNCPVCGESDMEKFFYAGDPEAPIISCSNHACASNGGTNHSAIKPEAPEGAKVTPIVQRKLLTVLMTRPVGAELAEADLKAIADGVVIRTTDSDLYLSQLRLRAQEDASLHDKIEVIYQDENGTQHPIGLRAEDESRWPPRFAQEQWDIETKISDLRIAVREAGK